MAKLYFRENVDFLPECSEMYAKPESWIPAESPHSEKLRRKQLRVGLSEHYILHTLPLETELQYLGLN
jgi:hypothetical protein